MGRPLPLSPAMPNPPPWSCGLFLGLALLSGCTPPLLRQVLPAELQGGPFAFLADGRTTREEVLLRLGTPSARFEGERILTYAISRRASGGWVWPGRSLEGGRKAPLFQARGMENLVLVFGSDGSLVRHSLVVSE